MIPAAFAQGSLFHRVDSLVVGPNEGLGKWLTLTVYERPVILFRGEEISGVDRKDLLQILNDPPRGEI